MCDLSRFTLADLVRCGAALRHVGDGAGSMEDVASRTCRYLYEHLLEGAPDSRPACALVRLFKTHAYRDLPRSLRSFAHALLPRSDGVVDCKCLVLLGTAGDLPEWSDRRRSRGHQAIPLVSAPAVRRIPMISSLLRQLGVEVPELSEQDPSILLDRAQESYGVFHVADAVDSPSIPFQEEFVRPHGIRSVVGFGGMLPSGDLYATILFSRVPLSREMAESFTPLALNLKLALLSFDGGTVFARRARGVRAKEGGR